MAHITVAMYMGGRITSGCGVMIIGVIIKKRRDTIILVFVEEPRMAAAVFLGHQICNVLSLRLRVLGMAAEDILAEGA